MDGDQINKEVKEWVKSTESELKAEAQSLGILHRKNSQSPTSSVAGIKGTTTNKFGIVSKISIKFRRHMVFVHKGVGRDTPIDKVGTTKRKAKEWFEPVTDRKIEKLADIVAENLGDTIVAKLHF